MNLTPKIRACGTALAALLMLALPALAPAGNGPTPTALAPLPGDTDSIAFDINNGGDVVGQSMGATTTVVVWDRHGNATMKLPLPGDLHSFAGSINNGGDVVGYSRSGAPPCGAGDTAVKWDRERWSRDYLSLEAGGSAPPRSARRPAAVDAATSAHPGLWSAGVACW